MVLFPLKRFLGSMWGDCYGYGTGFPRGCSSPRLIDEEVTTVAGVTADHGQSANGRPARAKPAAVERTHKDDDVGIIRIMFPDAPHSKHDALTEITWDEFFEEF